MLKKNWLRRGIEPGLRPADLIWFICFLNDKDEKLKNKDDIGLRHCLESIYQLMLLIWCRETQALRKLHARRCGT